MANRKPERRPWHPFLLLPRKRNLPSFPSVWAISLPLLRSPATSSWFPAARSGPENRKGKAWEAICKIGAIAAIEEKLNDFPPEERKEARLRQEKPLVEDFFLWLESIRTKLLPKFQTAKAVNYALNAKERLCRYLSDGRIPMTNNAAESAIRPFTVGRKNWLFSDSPKGAEASAAVYSLVETSKANGLDPEKYLSYVLTEMRGKSFVGNPEMPERWMPWSKDAQDNCKA